MIVIMDLHEAHNIILVETLEKDDLMDPNIVTRYIVSADRREFSANWISDPKYSEMARSLAVWDRKVVEAIKLLRG